MKILTVRLTTRFGTQYEQTYSGIYDVLEYLDKLIEENDKVVVLGIWEVA